MQILKLEQKKKLFFSRATKDKSKIWLELGLLIDYILRNYVTSNGKLTFKKFYILKHIKLAAYVFKMIGRLIK